MGGHWGNERDRAPTIVVQFARSALYLAAECGISVTAYSIPIFWRSLRLIVRLVHLVVPGLPHHVTQRGNRRERTFFEEGDYAVVCRAIWDRHPMEIETV